MPFDSTINEIKREIQKGNTARQKKRYKVAATHYLNALNKCVVSLKRPTPEITELQAEILKLLADVFYEEGDITHAFSYLTEAIDKSKNIREKAARTIFRAELNLLGAKISFEERDFEDALHNLSHTSTFYLSNTGFFDEDVLYIKLLEIRLFRIWVEFLQRDFDRVDRLLSEAFEDEIKLNSTKYFRYYQLYLAYRALIRVYEGRLHGAGEDLGKLQFLKFTIQEAKAIWKMAEGLLANEAKQFSTAKKYFKEAAKYADDFTSKLMQNEIQKRIAAYIRTIEASR